MCAEAVRFTHYHKGDEPYSTEIWLAQNLLLLMYKDKVRPFGLRILSAVVLQAS
jgi:hypothetical protein